MSDIERDGVSIDVNCVILDQSFPSTCSVNENNLTITFTATSNVNDVADEMLTAFNSESCQEAVANTFQYDGDVIVNKAASVVVYTKSPTVSRSPSEMPSLSSKPSTSSAPSLSSKPSSLPTISAHPSFQPSASIQPSTSFQPSPAPSKEYILPDYFGYDFVGEGECSDNNLISQYLYSYKRIGPGLLLSDCPIRCAQFRHFNKYRGFQFNSTSGACDCLFDSDISGLDLTNDDGRAKGDIDDIEPASDIECYRRASLAPPEVVIGFDYIGFGKCQDSSGEKYDYVNVTTGLAAKTIYSNCSAACKDFIPLPKGFWVEDSTPTCHCLFEENGLSSVYDGTNGVTLMEGGSATGPIVTSDYTGGQCYLDIPPPTMVPTNSPTTPRPVSFYLLSVYLIELGVLFLTIFLATTLSDNTTLSLAYKGEKECMVANNVLEKQKILTSFFFFTF